jgi:hypothetical protein
VLSPPSPVLAASSAAAPSPDRPESADVQAWTAQESQASAATVTATPRRRGRRGASRPAGPPVADG